MRPIRPHKLSLATGLHLHNGSLAPAFKQATKHLPLVLLEPGWALCSQQNNPYDITELLRDRAIEGGTPPPWVNKLRNIAYGIDVLLYEVHLQAEKHKMESDVKKQPIPGCGFCAKPKTFAFRCKVAHKMKAIKVEFAAIVKQRSDANTIRNT